MKCTTSPITYLPQQTTQDMMVIFCR